MTQKPIPLLDLKAQNDPLREEILAAMTRVVDSGSFILGEEVSALESEVAELLGVPFAVGVSSGTDALLMALMAAQVGPGDEVITSPFTFFATAGCIARLGATPRFVDIDPESFNIDPVLAKAAITERTKAIIPVHLFGRPAEMTSLRTLANDHGLVLIEDAAQAVLAATHEGPVGALGDFAAFSFFPSKNLGAMGDGGLVTCTDESTAEALRVLRAHGSKPKYFHHVVGGNFRLDALQAAVLRVKVPLVAGWTQARRENAELYGQLFAESQLGERLVAPEVGAGHVVNQYVVRAADRDGLQAHLQRAGIGTAIYYPKPLHLQGCFSGLGYRAGDLPHAEQACAEVLALPVFAELAEEDLRRVVDSVIAFYQD